MKKVGTLFGLVLFGVVLLSAPMQAHALSQASPLHYLAATPQQQICSGIGLTSAANGCGDNGALVQKTLATVINLLSIIVGVAAVIMVIVSGVRFITSGGESAKVASAKSTLIYAIIGIVIVALAQAIVLFVLNRVPH